MVKLVACILLLVVVASAVEEGNIVRIPRAEEHNIIFCNNRDQDKWVILDKETVSQSGKFLQIVEGTITYPRTGTGKEVITCIRVTDLDANGNGGYPVVLEGGLDFHYITIHFTSQRSHGYKFQIEIWGMVPQ